MTCLALHLAYDEYFDGPDDWRRMLGLRVRMGQETLGMYRTAYPWSLDPALMRWERLDGLALWSKTQRSGSLTAESWAIVLDCLGVSTLASSVRASAIQESLQVLLRQACDEVLTLSVPDGEALKTLKGYTAYAERSRAMSDRIRLLVLTLPYTDLRLPTGAVNEA